MDYRARLRKLQSTLTQKGLDALLVTSLPNIRYLCGFTGSAAALVVTPKTAFFFTDGRYTEQARDEVRGAKIKIGKKAALAAASEYLAADKTRGSRKLGVEADHLSLLDGQRLKRTVGPKVRIRPVSGLVEGQREVKDAEEIGLVRSAVELGSSLFEVALKTIRPGVAEAEVAAEMEYAARQAGAEAMSFETIIAAGERSALPHGRASSSRIPAGGFVVCDFGVILAGYCSDMTRTVYVGRPSASERDMYEAVREAQQAAVEAVGPGVGVGEVDRAARNVLKKKGLGRYFTHSTGHGVGLEIHEPPRIAAGQNESLALGMVITIEPGAYIPGRGGVRIEDMVVVTNNGCEVLTTTPKELITI
ncbi:MAG TPA: Xaa-Pro peptidase family protein [Terriglobales bacterium]